MKKFTDISDKNLNVEFKKDKPGSISNDIETLDNQLETGKNKLDGEWEIVSIVDVTTHDPNISEAIIINAELGKGEIKRGDLIYITAQIKRPGQAQAYHHSQMGVVKCRVTDIYNTMGILNNLI